MLSKEDLIAIREIIKEELEPIKEDTEITRDVTNKLVEWVDFYYGKEKPFPIDVDEAI